MEVFQLGGTFAPMRALLFSPVLLTVTSALAVQEMVPAEFPASRYERMQEESPFALATPPAAAPEAPKDSFTKDWVVTGLVRDRDAQGVERDFVTIRSRDQTQQFSLYGNEPNADGVSIVSVERSPQTGKSKVTLKKGDEFGTVEFNQMEVQAPVAAPAALGQPPRPGVPRPGMPGGSAQFLPGNPALNPVRQQLNAGRPQVPRPTLPQNGVQIPSGFPQVHSGAAPLPAAPGVGDARRRIRVINSKP